MDTDFHPIFDLESNTIINPDKEVIIGNNVWIGCRSTVLKGAKVEDFCVIAASTVVNKKIRGNHQIIGGNPVRVLKSNITWKPIA